MESFGIIEYFIISTSLIGIGTINYFLYRMYKWFTGLFVSTKRSKPAAKQTVHSSSPGVDRRSKYVVNVDAAEAYLRSRGYQV